MVIKGPVMAHPVVSVELPHVVVILGCTVRRDQVGLHGSQAGVTPRLDALGESGVVFDDVLVAAPWTRAASGAIVTGRHPLRLGLADVSVGRDDRGLGHSAFLLSEAMQHAGYRTVGITTNPNLHSDYGFAKGFDSYIQPRGLWRDDNAKVQGKAALPWLFDEVADAAATGRPVYVQSMWVDAHSPYQAKAADRAAFHSPGIPTEIAAYRVALNRLDTVVGKMLDGLQDAGLDADRTVVVFVSDHGEGLSFPPHHGHAHGRYLSPSSTGGVWVMAGPGVPAGRRVGGLASHVDVMPTLLALLGLNVPDTDGVDLSAAVVGRSVISPRRHAFTDTWFLDVNRAAVWSDAWACQRQFGGRAESHFPDACFDRVADPDHSTALPLNELDEVLGWWRVEAEVDVPLDARDVVPDRDQAAALEALGYADPEP